ncbi:MAG: flagellar hook basal-body protein [Acidobacteriaceae bacterium]|nr:flagellar hook basal-body protein [Acidobacteriaceae bacterium]MBV8571485.1 flagellar hook basal-body protein [Acidobacteriaceae bacterium]
MDPLTAAAATGLESRMEAMDMLANNLANASTSGFKADREFYSTYLSPEIATTLDPAVGPAPVVQRQWTDFAQGTLLETGNSTDLALSGPGFFSVNGPKGPLYTRSGSFLISPQGALTTAEGYPVRMLGGQSLQLQPGVPIQVGADGTIAQNGNPVGQLELVNFIDPSQLSKASGPYFQTTDASVTPSPAAGAQVFQGKVEASNSAPAEAAARMISLLRNFEMLQKAVKIGTDMNRQAIEEVARVGS